VSVRRLDAKYLESYTQNHTTMSHTIADLSPQLLKVKYIYMYISHVFFSVEYKKYADVLDGMLNSGHKKAAVAKVIRDQKA